jgi:hypothetical protein
MEREWRCKECDTPLGVERGVRLHLRHKQAQYVPYGPDLDGWFAENNAQSPTHQEVVR